MPEISVIVPVYKVEKYLPRCIESILAQSLQNLEIILVDDGSPDGCPEICDNFARKEQRIKVVHKKNGGLSSARNAGMAVASGRYIGFVDSDDTVSEYMYEKMYEVAIRENVDFVMADYIRILEDGTSYLKTLEIPAGYYSKKKIQNEIYPQLIMGLDLDYGPLLSVWHCLYRAEFLFHNNLFFDEEVRWSEDNIFSAIMGYYADSFYYMKGEGFYCYYQNPGTITTSYREGAWEVYKTMNKHLRVFFEKTVDYDFSNQLNLHLIYYACSCIGQTVVFPKSECRNKIEEILNDPELVSAFKHVTADNAGFKLKTQLWIMKHRLARVLSCMIGKR